MSEKENTLSSTVTVETFQLNCKSKIDKKSLVATSAIISIALKTSYEINGFD